MNTVVKGKRFDCAHIHAKAHNACISILEFYFILKKVDHTLLALNQLKKQLLSMSIRVFFYRNLNKYQ